MFRHTDPRPLIFNVLILLSEVIGSAKLKSGYIIKSIQQRQGRRADSFSPCARHISVHPTPAVSGMPVRQRLRSILESRQASQFCWRCALTRPRYSSRAPTLAASYDAGLRGLSDAAGIGTVSCLSEWYPETPNNKTPWQGIYYEKVYEYP